jgi:penicillin-binding protein 1A
MRRRRFWNYPRRGKGLVQRWLPSWRVVVGSILACIALGAGVFFAAWSSTEIPDDLDEVHTQASTVYYANGKEIGSYTQAQRELVEYETLPPYVGNSVVASENETFWDDIGIDIKSPARAAWVTLTTGDTQGGSTLTQQYVERYYLGTTKDIVGKAEEAIISLKITQAQEKPLILERYLNTIYWGRSASGIQAAAQAYFGKDAAELTYSEAALLAGIIPSPVNWDPSVNLDQATARWERSIRLMAEQGYITAEEANSAEFPEFIEKEENAGNSWGGQKGYIMAAVRDELEKNGVEPETIESGGLQIYTTIKPKLQREAAEIVKNMPEDTHENIRPSIVSIDPENGAIVTLYGGQDFVTQNKNTAWQDVIQGGSTFKPFTLIAALEDGHQLNETFDGNSPGQFENDEGEPWPNNFGDTDYGTVDLVEATQDSVNTAYVELNTEIGPERTTEVAHELGIREDEKNPIQAVQSNVLGAAAVRPVDLASAYATIASGGYYVKPHVVERVERLNGETFYEPDVSAEGRFEAEVINATTYAMTQVVEKGSGRAALELTGPDGQPRPVAGKTGTATGNKSAWFAGFTPQLATVVNIRQYRDVDVEAGILTNDAEIETFGGYDEITGSTWPAQAWTEFMQVALDGKDVVDFPEYTPPRPTFAPSPTPEETTPEWVEVPGNLVGMDVAQATAQLQELGLTVHAQAQNDESPKGTVVKVSNTGQVPADSAITLWVSTGVSDEPQGVVVPNVVGRDRGSAEADLRRVGLQVQVSEQHNEAAAGQVIGTDPGAGNEVDRDATVTIVVSLGPEQQETQEPEPPGPPTDDPTDETDPGGGNNGGGNGGGNGDDESED